MPGPGGEPHGYPPQGGMMGPPGQPPMPGHGGPQGWEGHGGAPGWGGQPNPYAQQAPRKKSGCGGCMLTIAVFLFVLLLVGAIVQLTGIADIWEFLFAVPGPVL